MEDPPLASLSLTHVHYVRCPICNLYTAAANTPSQNPNDPIAHACAFLALVPQALCITYATLIWSTREAEVGLMFAGQMACEALNWMLKRTIREKRPHRMPIYHLSFSTQSSNLFPFSSDWQRLRYALVTRSIRLVLCRFHNHVPPVTAQPSRAEYLDHPHPDFYSRKTRVICLGHRRCRCCRPEQNIPQLPH
jgi:hypothetical protein